MAAVGVIWFNTFHNIGVAVQFHAQAHRSRIMAARQCTMGLVYGQYLRGKANGWRSWLNRVNIAVFAAAVYQGGK